MAVLAAVQDLVLTWLDPRYLPRVSCRSGARHLRGERSMKRSNTLMAGECSAVCYGIYS